MRFIGARRRRRVRVLERRRETSFVREPPNEASLTRACDAVMFSCWSMAQDAESTGRGGDFDESALSVMSRCDSTASALRFNESPSLLINSSTRRRTRVSLSFCWSSLAVRTWRASADNVRKRRRGLAYARRRVRRRRPGRC